MSDEEEQLDSTLEEEEEEDAEEVALGPAALGLHRVGTKLPAKRSHSKPLQTLNARGMPARIRKKNRFYEEDDEKPKSPTKRAGSATSPVKTPKRRQVRSQYMKTEAEDDDEEEEGEEGDGDYEQRLVKQESHIISFEQMSKKDIDGTNQAVGRRLKNLLKLPKAHKFVMFEWFYSNLDQVLFCGDNDFQIYLRDSFPKLSARMLSRVEWTKIRRMMGKPRRCSQAFFDEERRELERKRQKIRLLQSRKMADVSFVKDLPRRIPLPFALGTKVTARLRQPQDGLFAGVIAAVDPVTHHYRVTFDRSGMGTYTVPDIELMSMEEIDTIPITNLTQNIRKKKLSTQYVASPLCALSKMDPVLGDARATGDDEDDMSSVLKSGGGGSGLAGGKESRVTVAGHPFKLVDLIVRVKKLLAAKTAKLKKLKQMNSDIAINKSYDEPISEDDQRQYANIIISLERINRQVHASLQEIQQFSKYLAKEPHIASLLQPSFLREKCRQMGEESVKKHNEYSMTDSRILRLITDLATVMWVTSYMSNNDQFSHVLRVLEGCVGEAREGLDASNTDVFMKNVMVHIHHIKMGISEMQPEMEVVEGTSQVGGGESDTEYGIAQLVEN